MWSLVSTSSSNFSMPCMCNAKFLKFLTCAVCCTFGEFCMSNHGVCLCIEGLMSICVLSFLGMIHCLLHVHACMHWIFDLSACTNRKTAGLDSQCVSKLFQYDRLAWPAHECCIDCGIGRAYFWPPLFGPVHSLWLSHTCYSHYCYFDIICEDCVFTLCLIVLTHFCAALCLTQPQCDFAEIVFPVDKGLTR